MNRRVVFALAVLAAFAVPGCGEPSDPSPTPPTGSGSSTPVPGQMTVTHLLIKFAGPNAGGAQNPPTRSKAQALALANSLLTDVLGGRKFEELVEKYTEDRNPEGKPNSNNGKPGSYTTATTNSGMVPEFEKASRETPVGKMAPEPVETMFGYHLIRRDK